AWFPRSLAWLVQQHRLVTSCHGLVSHWLGRVTRAYMPRKDFPNPETESLSRNLLMHVPSLSCKVSPKTKYVWSGYKRTCLESRPDTSNPAPGKSRPRKPVFSVPILLTCVQEAPRKVSSKTESVWSGFQNLVRTVAKTPSPRTGAVPTPETGFFGPDPPNMCSRSTTQSFVHNGVRLVGFQKIMIDGKTNVCSCHLAFCS